MPFIAHDSLICPIDGLALLFNNNSLCCSSGHRYDVGKPGYANLLSVQHKRSRAPGDSKEMVHARADFLSAGFYEPIACQLADIISVQGEDELSLVDAGCGEGYYLEKIDSLIDKRLDLVGFDISKWAVQRAAKRCQGTWLVASNKRIPLADNSADIVLDMFGFPDFDSFARVLKPDGKLICVTPGDKHLIELRKIIYPTVKPTNGRQYPDFFSRDTQRTITYEIKLDRTALDNLLAMTPHLYRAPKDRLARLAKLEQISMTIDVRLDVLNPT
jgi:23S rRNA (guanine745-N1)-methyltransferase